MFLREVSKNETGKEDITPPNSDPDFRRFVESSKFPKTFTTEPPKFPSVQDLQHSVGLPDPASMTQFNPESRAQNADVAMKPAQLESLVFPAGFQRPAYSNVMNNSFSQTPQAFSQMILPFGAAADFQTLHNQPRPDLLNSNSIVTPSSSDLQSFLGIMQHQKLPSQQELVVQQETPSLNPSIADTTTKETITESKPDSQNSGIVHETYTSLKPDGGIIIQQSENSSTESEEKYLEQPSSNLQVAQSEIQSSPMTLELQNPMTSKYESTGEMIVSKIVTNESSIKDEKETVKQENDDETNLATDEFIPLQIDEVIQNESATKQDHSAPIDDNNVDDSLKSQSSLPTAVDISEKIERLATSVQHSEVIPSIPLQQELGNPSVSKISGNFIPTYDPNQPLPPHQLPEQRYNTVSQRSISPNTALSQASGMAIPSIQSGFQSSKISQQPQQQQQSQQQQQQQTQQAAQYFPSFQTYPPALLRQLGIQLPQTYGQFSMPQNPQTNVVATGMSYQYPQPQFHGAQSSSQITPPAIPQQFMVQHQQFPQIQQLSQPQLQPPLSHNLLPSQPSSEQSDDSQSETRQSNRIRKQKTSTSGTKSPTPIEQQIGSTTQSTVPTVKRSQSPVPAEKRIKSDGRKSPIRSQSPTPTNLSQSPLRVTIPKEEEVIPVRQTSSNLQAWPVEAPVKNKMIDAVLAGDIHTLRLLLQTSLQLINIPDEKGLTPLIAAASLPSPSVSLECVRLLLVYGAVPRNRDKAGFTAAHWAAVMDNVDSLRLILHVAPELVEFPSAKNGDTPLHRSARYGTRNATKVLLTEFEAYPFSFNYDYETPIEVVGKCDNDLKTQLQVRSLVRPVFFECASNTRTLVLYHGECLLHETTEGHQEAPDRIMSILKELDRSDGVCGLVVSEDFARAPLEAVLRAHDRDYVQFIVDLDTQLRSEGATNPVAFTPRVQRALTTATKFKPEQGCDTMFSAGTLGAALRAAGSVIRAIDLVLNGVSRNAFCAVRPPGHHAGTKGLLDDATSCGFCIINNIMIGALHALSAYPTVVRRVAIIDFDVHHGNGTQDIIQQRIGPYSRDAVLFVSIHICDREEDSEENSKAESSQPSTPVATRGRRYWEFYPGSGATDIWQKNIFNIPIVPLWKEAELNAVNQTSAVGGGNAVRTSRSRSSSLTNDGAASNTGGRLAYRKAVKEKVIPLVRAYKPDLILLSAGFDAGAGDVGCCKATNDGKAISGADLTPADFEYITKNLVKLANICCQGRIISVLEGGYGKWTKNTGDDPKKMELNRDSFAKSVAAHVLALSGVSNDS